MSPPGIVSMVDQTLAALVNPIRRGVVEVLAQRPMRPGDSAQQLDTSASSLSKTLRVLRRHGVVGESHSEYDARVRIYTLRAAPMTDLRAWLDTAERGWAEQLAAFAEFVEREE